MARENRGSLSARAVFRYGLSRTLESALQSALPVQLGQLLTFFRPCNCSLLKMVAVNSSENTYPSVEYPALHPRRQKSLATAVVRSPNVSYKNCSYVRNDQNFCSVFKGNFSRTNTRIKLMTCCRSQR